MAAVHGASLALTRASVPPAICREYAAAPARSASGRLDDLFDRQLELMLRRGFLDLA